MTRIGDTRSVVVDTIRDFPDGTAVGNNPETWAHENKHVFGYDGSDDTENIGAPGYERLANGKYVPYRTGSELTPEEIADIHNEAKRIGDTKKIDPVRVNFIRDWKIDKTSDVFFYTNSTLTAEYNVTDIDELFIFSEEPFTNYNFKLSFEDIRPLNKNANITIRIFFDSDGNPLTGSNGYDRIALLNATGTFPFNGSYRLELLNTSGHTPLFKDITNVSTILNYELIDVKDPSYVPKSYGYDLSFDISDGALNALNLSSNRSNVLVQADYPATQVRDDTGAGKRIKG